LLQVLRQQGRILLRLDALDAARAGRMTVASPQPAPAGLPIGSRAPVFRLKGLRGQFITLADLITSGKPLLLIFSNPECGPCQSLVPEIGRWSKEHRASLRIVVVNEGGF